MPVEVFDNLINFRFIVTFLIVLGACLPIVYSIWKTYQDDRAEKKN